MTIRTYVAVTGVLFAFLVVAHLARIFTEDASLASSPAYLLITACSAALSIWAWAVLRRAKSAGQA